MVPLNHIAATVALAAGLLAAGVFPEPIRGQAHPSIEAARQLRESGDYPAAIDTLEAYLGRNPEDSGARWMLGQLLVWTGDHRRARVAYEAALPGQTEDPWIWLEYSDLLVAVDDLGTAEEVLTGLRERGGPDVGPGAVFRLGNLAYWKWDLPEALRLYETVLVDNPGHQGAKQALQEIRNLIRPWIRSSLQIVDDDQPLRRYSLALEGGAYLSPLWSVSGRAAPGAVDQRTTTGLGDAQVEIRGYIPNLRLELAGRAGGAWQGNARGPGRSWEGGAEMSLRLRKRIALAGGVSHRRYLWTRASADTLLMVDALELGLSRSEATGWAGEIAFRRETFPDDNEVQTAFGWALAPLAKGIRVGYALSWSDARETRWSPKLQSPDEGGPPFPLPSETGDVPGHFAPYYTPEEVLAHSLLGELSVPLGRGRFRFNSSWGFKATEMAPVLYLTAQGEPAVTFYERGHTPWSVAATTTTGLGRNLSFEASVEHRKTAFYGLTRFHLSTVYRFPIGAGVR